MRRLPILVATTIVGVYFVLLGVTTLDAASGPVNELSRAIRDVGSRLGVQMSGTGSAWQTVVAIAAIATGVAVVLAAVGVLKDSIGKTTLLVAMILWVVYIVYYDFIAGIPSGTSQVLAWAFRLSNHLAIGAFLLVGATEPEGR